MTDTQHLLAEYRRNGSDAAFRELVERFVDLVYSTALRLAAGDTHRAEDVTQTVFVNLARKAQSLPEDVRLGGWLHRDTFFVATTLTRGDHRRQTRERQALEMNALQNHFEADYSQVAPILDEAINELGEADRTAILLRFFEQQDFHAVGQALGSNEDAARMRVTRALEKLEGFLKRRGVTTSAASLGLVLTANAVQAAPVGLAITISTAAALAGTTIATTATATAIKTIAMTTLQKVIIGTTLAVAVGTGIYEARQVRTLRNQQAPLAEQIRQLQSGREEGTRQLAALRDENERLNRNAVDLLKLRGEVGILRGQASQLEKLREEKRPPDAALAATQNQLAQTPLGAFVRRQIDTVSAMRQLALCMRQYALDNASQFATRFDQLTNELNYVTNFEGNIGLDTFEFVNVGRVTDAMPNKIILRERIPRQTPDGKWERG